MKWHLYAPYILESEPLDGKYQRMRIYRCGVKDSQATYYTLQGVDKDLVQTCLGRGETAEACKKLAEDFI